MRGRGAGSPFAVDMLLYRSVAMCRRVLGPAVVAGMSMSCCGRTAGSFAAEDLRRFEHRRSGHVVVVSCLMGFQAGGWLRWGRGRLMSSWVDGAATAVGLVGVRTGPGCRRWPL